MAEGDLAQIQVVVGSIDNYQTTWGFASTSGVTDWRAILLEGFVTLVVPILVAGVSEDLRLVEVVCKDVVPGTGVDEIYDPPVHTPGGQAGRPVSPQVCGKIIWLTELAGRSYSGRTFLPGLPFEWMENDPMEWGVPFNTYVQDIGEAMMMAYGPDGTSTFGRFVVISRQLNNVVRDTPVGTQIIDWRRVQAARTQRRRQHS